MWRLDGAVQLWNMQAGTGERLLEERAEGITGFAISPDGTEVLAGNRNGGMRLWRMDTGQEVRRFTRSVERPLAISPDGRLALASRPEDPTMELFLMLPPMPQKTSPSGAEHNAIKIWNLDTGAELGCLAGHTDLVACATFSPDGTRVLSVSFDGTMRLWDVARAQEIRVFEGRTGWVTYVALCPDGRQALAGYYDRSIRLWDLESGREVRRFNGHRAAVTSLALAPDGRSFLSGSFDGTMRLWDLESGGQSRVFRDDGLPILGVHSSVDGRAASWSLWGTMRVWEVKE
jgi:WD40 repeat protein